MTKSACSRAPCGRRHRRLLAAILIYVASISNPLAEDIDARKHWWGFTAVDGWPQFVGIWQDLHEITIMYTGDRWCSARARLSANNTFVQITNSCDHLNRKITTIKLSNSGARLKYQILDRHGKQPRETGYLLPVK